MTTERIIELLDYIIVFPNEDADKKRTQNHPFIACEMLSESGPIHDKILENDVIMGKLFSFLDEPRLNSTLAGYFSKVVQPLFARNPEKTMGYFIANGTLPKLIQHLYIKSIVDIILKILTFDNSQQEFFPEERKQLVQDMTSALNTASEYSVHFAGYILSEVLNKSMEINCWKELTGAVIEKENLFKYFEGLIADDCFKSTSCGGVLKTLLGVFSRIDLTKYFEELAFADVFIEFLPKLLTKLATPSKVQLLGTNGESAEALGESRLKVIEIISLAIRLENENLHEAVAQSGVLSEITKLFFDMPWNSILHNVVDNIVVGCVLSRKDSLIHAMLATSNFLDKMVSVGLSPKDGHRLGILGHINKLANYLKSTECEVVKELLNSTQQWNDFSNDYLEVRNTCESKILGDMGKKGESSSSEDDIHDLEPEQDYMRGNYGYEEPVKTLGEENTENTENPPVVHEEPHHETGHFTDVLEQKISEISLVETVPEENKNEDEFHSPQKHIPTIAHSHPVSATFSPGSPINNPDYFSLNFWSLHIKVDEIDQLDPL